MICIIWHELRDFRPIQLPILLGRQASRMPRLKASAELSLQESLPTIPDLPAVPIIKSCFPSENKAPRPRFLKTPRIIISYSSGETVALTNYIIYNFHYVVN